MQKDLTDFRTNFFLQAYPTMLGHLAYILEKHSRGVCGPGFDFRECIHTFSLESKCCHPFWCFKNRPGVIRPVDSTFGCNCAPQWLTSVSPGCCGRLLRNKEPIFITLLWFYLNIQLYLKPILEEQFAFIIHSLEDCIQIQFTMWKNNKFGKFVSQNPFLLTYFFTSIGSFLLKCKLWPHLISITKQDRDYIYPCREKVVIKVVQKLG